MPAPSAQAEALRLTDDLAVELARQFGTPLYVFDEACFRSRIRRYQAAFKANFAQTELTFASKSNSTLAVVKMAHQEGCRIDTASEGELRAALAVGISGADCHLHGNNKSEAEITFALDAGIGQIMVDNFNEISLLARLGVPSGTSLVLRLAPGVDPVTHAKISTGQADTKFGFNITDGSAEKALLACLSHRLPLIGFHCHVGSQLLDPEAQITGGSIITQFARDMKERHGFAASLLNIGGGLGITYMEGESPMAVEDYCALIAKAMKPELEAAGLDPVIAQEPGRSLAGPAGITLYRVGVLKEVPAAGGRKTYAAVDGGLSDNPRPALYGSKYTVLPVDDPGSSGAKLSDVSGGAAAVTVSGKHCETDKLFEGIQLPGSFQEGDLLQVLGTGAYNSAMASNYNRLLRPASVLIRRSGQFDVIQARETWEQLFERERVPEDLL